jgi:hypothetical protein
VQFASPGCEFCKNALAYRIILKEYEKLKRAIRVIIKVRTPALVAQVVED